MRRTPQEQRGRSGSTQLLLLFALTFFLATAFKIGGYFRDDVVARKAVCSVDAAATAALYLLEPMEYTPPALEAPLAPSSLLDIVRRTALVNGHFPEIFHPITPQDLTSGLAWVSLTVKPLSSTMHPYTGQVRGIPAMRIGPGRVWTDNAGRATAATGVLPLGLQQSAIPSPLPLPFNVRLGDATAPASFLQWGVSSPAVVPHLQALGFAHGAPPEGTPPPALAVNDIVARLIPAQPMVDETGARLAGRVALLPVLQDSRVTGFVRVRIHWLSPASPYRLQLSLAPSAAARAATGPKQPRNAIAPAPGEVAKYGAVLRPWRLP